MNTCFLAFYGIGGFFTGQLADKYTKRKLIFYIYNGIALTMILLGMLHFIPVESQHRWLHVYYILKIINGSLQSPMWAVNMVLMSKWFPRTGRGLLLGIWACNTSTGDIIGVQTYKFVTEGDKHKWYIAFWIIGVLVFLFGLLSLLLLAENPEELGITYGSEGSQQIDTSQNDRD